MILYHSIRNLHIDHIVNITNSRMSTLIIIKKHQTIQVSLFVISLYLDDERRTDWLDHWNQCICMCTWMIIWAHKEMPDIKYQTVHSQFREVIYYIRVLKYQFSHLYF